MNHPRIRPFRDHPWRRIGLSAGVAVILHAGALGIGAYYFRDTFGAQPKVPRLTHQKLEQAVAEANSHPPIVSAIYGPGPEGGDERFVPSDGWTTTSFFEPAWSWWSWQAVPDLTADLVVPSSSRRPDPNPGSNISQP